MLPICQSLSKNIYIVRILLHRKLCLQSVHKPSTAINFMQRRSCSSEGETKKNFNFLIRITPILGLLVAAIIIRKRKYVQLSEKLTNCYSVPIPSELFNSKLLLYRYKDFVFPSRILLSDDFSNLKEFMFRDSDIVVASFPKAGITWVQEIVYMLCHDCKPTNENSDVLETRFPYLEYPYPGIKAVEKIDGQRLIKTHLPFSLLPDSFNFVKPKLIYVVRNPRDVAVSYFHFMKLLTESSFVGTFDQFVDLFTSNKVPYSPFGDHVDSYLGKKSDSNILFVSYEDLKMDPVKVITDIAIFLQIDVDSNDILNVVAATNFKSMKDNPAVNYEHWKEYGFAHRDGRFLRKGEIGDWKNYFDDELLAKFITWEKKLKFSFDCTCQP